MFDFSEKEVLELKSIKKGDVIEWYRTYLRQPSPNCRRLAIRVWGCNSDMKDIDQKMMTPERVIEDLAAFKLSALFYQGMC